MGNPNDEPRIRVSMISKIFTHIFDPTMKKDEIRAAIMEMIDLKLTEGYFQNMASEAATRARAALPKDPRICAWPDWNPEPKCCGDPENPGCCLLESEAQLL